MARAQMQLFFEKNGANAYQAQKKRETKKFSLIILCNIGTKKFGRKTQNFTVKFFGRKVKNYFLQSNRLPKHPESPLKYPLNSGFSAVLRTF